MPTAHAALDLRIGGTAVLSFGENQPHPWTRI